MVLVPIYQVICRKQVDVRCLIIIRLCYVLVLLISFPSKFLDDDITASAADQMLLSIC